tara:strand:+ start:6120 stop:7745 length:1626 start_codon:yes stop_codon:yes gene_type:complete
MSMSSMSIESEDNGEFAAIATGERSDGGQLGTRGKEQKEKSAPDVRVEGMDDDDSFSLRKFAAFVGPGFLMCIAYVDPGNFESNLQAGCQFGYSLLWVLLWATLMGLYIQALSVRLGLATGWHLARVMRDEYPTPVRYSLWIVTELAIIASDVPEVIGTALALKLIFGLPTVWGVLVTSASTLLFLALQQFGVRKLEAFMGSLVGVMSVCFVAQMGMLEGGDGGEVMKGIVVPIFQNGKALFIGVSLLGAVVMPHNLFLHSALVLSRSFELGERAVRRALKYNVAESALALAVTLVINFAVTIVAAQSIRDADFDDPTGEKRRGIIDRPLQNAPDMLKDVLGKSAKGLFAAALLASGQSSTITGTYAGQFVMEGFLEIKINPVLRAFLTRTCAILPSLLVTIIAGDEYAEFLIVISSVFLSFQLPFALIPLVKFCGSEKIVGAMAIDPRALQRTWVIVSAIVFANIVLLCVWVHESGAVNGSPGGVFLGLFVALFMLLYCASLSALALRPVTQNLTMQVRDRLESKDFDGQDTSAEGEEYI